MQSKIKKIKVLHDYYLYEMYMKNIYKNTYS